MAYIPQAYAANIFNSQGNVDSSSNRYNPNWWNHPNLRWGNPTAQQQQPWQQNNPSTVVRLEPSLEDLVKQMAIQNLQFQQRIDSTIHNLGTQIGQLATSICQIHIQRSTQLPAQPVVNSIVNANVSAITLRSGKAVDTPGPPPTENASGSSKKKYKPISVTTPSLKEDDDACQAVFTADFPSLSNLDYTYTCDVGTNTHLCSVCVENEVALQADTMPNVPNDIGFIEDVATATTILPSIEKPPILELKPPPKNLKYAYLEGNGDLSVIISAKFDSEQEGKLPPVLSKHRKGIGWTVADIVGKKVRQTQQQLNPLILNVWRKKVTKHVCNNHKKAFCAKHHPPTSFNFYTLNREFSFLILKLYLLLTLRTMCDLSVGGIF